MSRKKAVAKYVIPEMCNGCTAYSGERMQCPIQDEPGWLYKRYGVCWSKRTDPSVDEQIYSDIKEYRRKVMGG